MFVNTVKYCKIREILPGGPGQHFLDFTIFHNISHVSQYCTLYCTVAAPVCKWPGTQGSRCEVAAAAFCQVAARSCRGATSSRPPQSVTCDSNVTNHAPSPSPGPTRHGDSAGGQSQFSHAAAGPGPRAGAALRRRPGRLRWPRRGSPESRVGRPGAATRRHAGPGPGAAPPWAIMISATDGPGPAAAESKVMSDVITMARRRRRWPVPAAAAAGSRSAGT